MILNGRRDLREVYLSSDNNGSGSNYHFVSLSAYALRSEGSLVPSVRRGKYLSLHKASDRHNLLTRFHSLYLFNIGEFTCMQLGIRNQTQVRQELRVVIGVK